MKTIILIAISILFSSPVYSNPSLKNSVWGSAANYAGINVATLYSIAVHESGMRWRDGTFRPWPWTLNVNEGKHGIKPGARRYANKQAAEQALLHLIRLGIRNVDVGIMQVNLYWHGDKVANDTQLLDPKTNITVAAGYLKDLNTKNNVSKTVADYHAPSNPARGKAYVKHVKHYEKIINEKLQ
ncbi:transglycosylase SLT domain-containing protein [Methylophaga sp.]|uniref:transglycosylase SLT domain-containing protein n=1 Tax=Methylophaga sp. TaxID=2024840 RepID=UPI002719D4F8|nr:transglycosylase SLT domain-containing protein [Methylophaga sp.]MDO8827871.1 transglycosylase SLT domain-containing protein [Methylophaga sp.]